MNKKAITKIQRIGIGSLTGIIGVLFMSFGSAYGNLWIMRFGIALTAAGGWLITW